MAAVQGFRQRPLQFCDILHPPARQAVCLGQLDKIRTAVQRRLGVVAVVDQGLPLANHAQRLIIINDGDDWQLIILLRRQLIAVHPEAAVAGDVDDGLVGVAAFGADGGAEAEAAILGALTTPGTTRPLAILDLGAGSTDASIINPKGDIIATHLAGAGDMVTMIIARELGLEDRYLAEEIKKYPLAKVESLFHLRHEDGSVQFFSTPLPPAVFARVCVVKPDELVPLPGDLALEKVRAIRRSAKERVFVTNALRALRQVSPTGNIRDIPFVVLVGGSSLDFEVPQLVTDALAHYRLVAGRGNIRGSEGPRNAVATGLILSWHKEFAHGQ